jgi:hypothetical protein
LSIATDQHLHGAIIRTARKQGHVLDGDFSGNLWRWNDARGPGTSMSISA